MNYLIYPIKLMNITQTYENDFTHKRHTIGKPKDYPIDDNCGSTKKDGYFYCPCDEMIVKKIYGVGTNSTNVLWLESVTPVITPKFNDYVTIMIGHIDDRELKKIKVGQKFKRKEKIALEGTDGNVTGAHFHIVIGRGKLQGSGWIKNTNNIWVINTTGGAVKPEEAFYIDKDFTTVKSTGNLKFLEINYQKPNYYYVMAKSLNVRIGPGTSYKVVNTLPRNTRIIIKEFENGWGKISDKEYVSGNYITPDEPIKYYEIKITTPDSLNVRKYPSGNILTTNSPLPKETTVAIMEIKKNWVKINTDRWVYKEYLK